jgi:hypothetical protein
MRASLNSNRGSDPAKVDFDRIFDGRFPIAGASAVRRKPDVVEMLSTRRF